MLHAHALLCRIRRQGGHLAAHAAATSHVASAIQASKRGKECIGAASHLEGLCELPERAGVRRAANGGTIYPRQRHCWVCVVDRRCAEREAPPVIAAAKARRRHQALHRLLLLGPDRAALRPARQQRGSLHAGVPCRAPCRTRTADSSGHHPPLLPSRANPPDGQCRLVQRILLVVASLRIISWCCLRYWLAVSAGHGAERDPRHEDDARGHEPQPPGPQTGGHPQRCSSGGTPARMCWPPTEACRSDELATLVARVAPLG